MAEVLAKQPRPQGPRLAIVTNAGGPAVLATDMLVTGGGKLAELSSGDHSTPLTVFSQPPGVTAIPSTFSATPGQTYGKAIDIAAKDPNNDGLAGDSNAASHDRRDGHGD